MSGCTRGPGRAASGEAVRRGELFSKNGVATETPSPCWWSGRTTGDDWGGEHKGEHAKRKKTKKHMTSSILMEPFITSDALLFRPVANEH